MCVPLSDLHCFNPRSPRGGATATLINLSTRRAFQSTLPAWGSDARRRGGRGAGLGFNPRSPRGGATSARPELGCDGHVSIHAPRVGERPLSLVKGVVAQKFQSTLPAWGSDVRSRRYWRSRERFQSTLPAWGSDLLPSKLEGAEVRVSIHAPRVGERREEQKFYLLFLMFQSTLPAWGSDFDRADIGVVGRGFNPRSPRGGATAPPRRRRGGVALQSTLPAWGSDGVRAIPTPP